MAGQTIQISVLADTKKFSSAMKNLSNESGLSKVASGLKAVGKAAAVGLAAGAAALGAFAVKSVGAASDLQQSIGGVDAIFKDNADTIHQWAKSAAGDLGLSQNSYNQLATIIGTTLKNSGTPMDELAGKTNDLIGVSADLAATFGGDVTTASNAMASALRGEFEPLRQYGVSLSQADINARALADSGKESADSLTKQERALATQALILEQSADAQGAFARESNTLAGQTERLKAKFENISATVGTYLLPVITTVVTWLSDNLEPAFQRLSGWIESTGVPAFQQFATWIQDNIVPALQQMGDFLTGTVVPALQDAATWVQNNRDWLEPLAVAITTMVVAYQSYVKVMAIWTAATAAAKAVQIAFNAAMAANPVGLLILAIAGLVAGLVYFFTQTETGQRIIQDAWAAIQGAIEAVKTWFTDSLVPALEGAWNTITSGLSSFATWLSDTWTSIKETATEKWNSLLDFVRAIPEKITGFFLNFTLLGLLIQHWDSIKASATEKWNALLDWIKGVPDRFMANLAALGNLAAKIGGWVQGAKDKALEKFNSLVDWVKGIPDRIVTNLGNLATLLTSAGRSIIEGLWNGLKAKWESVKDWVTGIGDWIAQNKGPKAYDLQLLVNAGKWIMQGLQAGLESEIPNLRRTLQGVSDEVAATPMEPLQVNSRPKVRIGTTNRNRGVESGQQPQQAPAVALSGPVTLSRETVEELAAVILGGARRVGVETARQQLMYQRTGGRR